MLDIKRVESQIHTINVVVKIDEEEIVREYKVKFTMRELPNDMKFLAFIDGISLFHYM